MSEEKFKNKLLSIVFLTVVSMNLPLSYSNLMTLILNLQPVTTTRIYVLHKITIALKLMSYTKGSTARKRVANNVTNGINSSQTGTT